MKQYSRVCERVDLDAIFYNFQMMKANIKDGVQMIAVIKTDGYLGLRSCNTGRSCRLEKK